MTDAERQALRSAKAGDSDAFGVLVRLHSRPLFRTAVRIVGSAAAAEDVVQETFLRAYRALARFDERYELLPWLQRIAINAAIDEVRRAQREAPLGRAAARALGDLSADERTAFVLRHLEGRPIAEISRALGKGAGVALAERTLASERDEELLDGAAFALAESEVPRAAEVRRQALFWLGQSDDPRAMAALEEILR